MHIRLLDANSLGYVHHHGQPHLAAPSGEPVQAVTGVLAAARHKLERTPDILNVWIWDGRAQWRYDLHPLYKSGRRRTPEQRQDRQDYRWQQPWIQKALRCLPVLQLTHPGAEADDVAWGLARQLSKQGHLVTLETVDADWLQGVTGRVRWQNARSPHQLVELEGFLATSGGYLSPATVGHTKALTGDASDDIEGVEGIALKRAFGLLSKYKTLEALLAATEDFATFSQEPSYAHALMTPEIQTLVRRNLALIDISRGPVLKGEGCVLDVGGWDDLDFYEVALDLGLEHWKNQISGWRRVGERALESGPIQVVKRALASLEQSWGP